MSDDTYEEGYNVGYDEGHCAGTEERHKGYEKALGRIKTLEDILYQVDRVLNNDPAYLKKQVIQEIRSYLSQ